MAHSVSAANSTLTLTIGDWRAATGLASLNRALGSLSSLVGVPIEVERFSADLMFDASEQEMVEVFKPIDGGELAVGWVASGEVTTLNLQLMADSPTVKILQDLAAAQNRGRETFRIDATLDNIAQGMRYILSGGAFMRTQPLPSYGKVQNPLRFSFTFGSCTPQPIS